MEDDKIIALYFDRDEQAIRETDIKYGRLCHNVAQNILNDPEDSEECVNDTYLSAWNAIPPTRPTRFMAFLCKIVRNLSLKRLDYNLARKRNAGVLVSLSELEAVLPDDRFAPGLEDAEIGRLISDFLRTEKQEARAVFIRRYYFFDSVSEIAKRYSFTESRVKTMLLRTRNRLRIYLQKEGVEV